MSLKLDGKKLSLEIEERLNDYISINKITAKRAPGLAVIRIGEDPASGVYVNNKEKACSRIGIKSFIFHLEDSVEQKEVEQLIIKLNSDKDIDGMLLQLPIPKKFDEQKLISHINPSKDVDGLNEVNIGKLVKNEPAMRSCTPAGIINLSGKFNKGDHIKILDTKNKEFARGLSSFSSEEINKIMGCHSNEIQKKLGYITKSEVVHKDDMVEV